MKSTPLSRWLVLGNSMIIIAISAALAGWAIVVFTLYIDTVKVMLSMVLLPCSLAVGILQYAAGFRRNLVAAQVVSVMHCFGCLLSGFYCMLAVLIFLNHEKSPVSDEGVDAFLATCVFVYCCFCVWMNDRERHYLQKAKKAEDSSVASGSARPFQFTLRELMGAIVVLSIIVSVARYTVQDANKNFREHISREEVPASLFQLPNDAADICYCLSDGGRLAYEFTIDEPGFFRWAENLLDQWSAGSVASIEKIPQNEHEIIGSYLCLRYNMPFGDHTKYVLIQQGYCCEYIKDDKGFRLAYGTDTGRAYYYGPVFTRQP